ncbi:MAG: DivIVA domain-containing protein [Actinomycetota bacterium]|nr:DivIVA domain-containing protein [Actinomycetota bacterium]
MDVSPKTLREVEFREKLRGYHPEDVDQFLEQVAVGLEGMQDRLRQAVERAQRAESVAAAAPSSPAPAPPAPPMGDTSASEETLRKTLVLAQRTADLAVQEAREQAARILSSAEQQAQARLSEAEERARRTHEDALSDVRAELTSLEVTRQRAQQDVDALNRWVEDHRGELSANLSEALSLVERVGVRSPAPTSRPIDVPPPPRPAGPSGASTPGGPGPGPLPGGPMPGGPMPGAPGSAAPGVGQGPGSAPQRQSPASQGLSSQGFVSQAPGSQAPVSQASTTGSTALPSRPGSSSSRQAPPAPYRAPLGTPGGPPGPRPGAPTFKVSPRRDAGEDGPPTVAWQPIDTKRPHELSADDVDPTPGQGTPVVDDRGLAIDPEEQALDDFFEDDDDSGYLGERRFGGRLRRRR